MKSVNSDYKIIEGFLHIPIIHLLTPTEGDVVMLDRWWRQDDEGNALIYVGSGSKNSFGQFRTFAPQCNASLKIAARLYKNQIVLISKAYFPVNMAERD